LVFAMIPLSLKLAPGAEARSPIAVVIIGGVLSSMFLTLLIVPVVHPTGRHHHLGPRSP